MRNAKVLFVALVAGGVSALSAADPPNAGGEYTYTGSPAAMRTTGQTGDQIWNVPNPITVTSFYPGQFDVVPYWQIYTGASITCSGFDRFMSGNVVFENEVKWTGNDNYIGYTGPTKILLRNGGSLTANPNGILIGVFYKDGYVGHATVFMEEPSNLSTTNGNIVVGNDWSSTLWMDGGVVSLTNASLRVGSGSKTTDGGYVRLNGGDVSLRGDRNGDVVNLGCSTAYSSVHVSGGLLRTRNSGLSGSIYFYVAGKSNRTTDIYVDGGFLDMWNERIALGDWGSGVNASGARATLTVDGEGRVRIPILALGKSGSGGTSVVNLNGGRFELSQLFADYANTGNRRYVNFDGGTLAIIYDSRINQRGRIGSIGEKIVYPGGGTIETPYGVIATNTSSFRAAEGYGVSGITLSHAGSGYVTAPEVKITGGSGSNATAYAVLNKDRTLEKIVVTCRGEGYAAGDTVTVDIVSATGSGASATATLAPNAGGVIRKAGKGELKQQATATFGSDFEIVEGTYGMDGATVSSTSAFRMSESTALQPYNGTSSSLDRLEVWNGIVSIRSRSFTAEDATLAIGALTVSNGLALVTHTNSLALALTATDLTATSSAESPVVNGLVYANKGAARYRKPSPMVRMADGTLVPAETTATTGPDANWSPSADHGEADAPDVSVVNSIVMPLTPPVNSYVKNAGLLEVKSGMIVVRRPQEDCQRVEVTGGGALTTRAKGGMFIYGDSYEVGKRSMSTANGNVVHRGNWRRLFGPFADPDSSTPMSLTVAGEKQSRPELGFQTWLLRVQSFSGGLNLVNGGVFIQTDTGLGASGSPVRASGYCSITAHNWTFAVTHPIELLEGSALIFSPANPNSGNTISSTLSGPGNLLTSDINRPGYEMAFTGDHSAFTGGYYIQGNARISPSVFSAQAGICLADGTNGVGVIETSGSFTRPAGTGKGEVCWKTHPAYTNLNYGLRGGFAGKGGDLTVNLGGAGAKLAVGSDYLPDGAVVQMQSQYADGALTFMNGFELGGKTQAVNVWSGKTATFAGALSDVVGGGALAVTGDLRLDSATLEVGAANLSAPMLTVNGALTLAGTLNLALGVTKEELAANDKVTLATATGGICGTLAIAGNVPSNWTVLARANSLVLKKINGAMVIIR